MPEKTTKYFTYPHVVDKEDIDELGHVGNYHFIKLTQRAAIAHSSANGWPPQRFNDLDAGWVVRSNKITYFKPAYKGDSIRVKTWVHTVKSVSCFRRFEVLNTKGEMLVKADTEFAFVSYSKQKLLRIPIELRIVCELMGI